MKRSIFTKCFEATKAEELELKMNRWLADNPRATIVQMIQSQSSVFQPKAMDPFGFVEKTVCIMTILWKTGPATR